MRLFCGTSESSTRRGSTERHYGVGRNQTTHHELGGGATNAKSKRLGLIDKRSAVCGHVDKIHRVQVPHGAIYRFQIVRNARTELQRACMIVCESSTEPTADGEKRTTALLEIISDIIRPQTSGRQRPNEVRAQKRIITGPGAHHNGVAAESFSEQTTKNRKEVPHLVYGSKPSKFPSSLDVDAVGMSAVTIELRRPKRAILLRSATKSC